MKKLVAAAALLVLACCEPTGEGASPPPAETTEPIIESTATLEVPVVADFSVAPAAPDTELSTVDAPALRAGAGRVALFAIERPPVPPRCVVAARLRLFLERSSDLAAEELAIYPSHVFDAAAKRDGDRFGYSGALLDVRPRALQASAGAGWTDWDVTEIVERWTRGHAFPSRGMYAPSRGPIVLALRDVSLAEPFARVRVASTESSSPPHLRVTARGNCSP